jgi:hypothetical protein
MGLHHSWVPVASVIGFAEGTDVIFVGTFASVYMIELKSGRATKVLDESPNGKNTGDWKLTDLKLAIYAVIQYS